MTFKMGFNRRTRSTVKQQMKAHLPYTKRGFVVFRQNKESFEQPQNFSLKRVFFFFTEQIFYKMRGFFSLFSTPPAINPMDLSFLPLMFQMCTISFLTIQLTRIPGNIHLGQLVAPVHSTDGIPATQCTDHSTSSPHRYYLYVNSDTFVHQLPALISERLLQPHPRSIMIIIMMGIFVLPSTQQLPP